MKRVKAIIVLLAVACALQASCGVPGKGVQSAADVLPEAWSSADSIMCVQPQKTVGEALRDAALSEWIGSTEKIVYVQGFGDQDLWNHQCGFPAGPCVCGRRDVVLASIAGLAVNSKGGKYATFRYDPATKKTSMDLTFLVYMTRKSEKQGECASVEMSLLKGVKKYVLEKQICLDQPAKDQFFELSKPEPEAAPAAEGGESDETK
ncbi:MAG: hypothetical protein ABIJ56_16900 [Pseudomonadota bacterium]